MKSHRCTSITSLGGGTGLSTLLRGLKKYTKNITAVVTVADDGGGSGIIRNEFGILPPGDIRNCILALANVEPIMEQLLQYRYKEGTLNGQSFGNLLIAAMTDLCGGFLQGIKHISSVLAVTGEVYPVSLDDLILSAELDNGSLIVGESHIPKESIRQNSGIKEVSIEPANARALPEAIEAIINADIVTIGPGSLYTSLIPILLIKEVKEALIATKAKRVYISNIMTQPGETTGYNLANHIEAICKYGGNIIDYCIVNNKEPESSILENYLSDNARPVYYEKSDLKGLDIELIERDLLYVKSGYIRHDSDTLAATVLELL